MEDDAPNEAVGWVWSDGSTTRFINQARSPVRFAVGTIQMAEALAAVDPERKTLVALYHSHPNGNPEPSPYDVAQMFRQYQMDAVFPWVILTPDGIPHVWQWAETEVREVVLSAV